MKRCRAENVKKNEIPKLRNPYLFIYCVLASLHGCVFVSGSQGITAANKLTEDEGRDEQQNLKREDKSMWSAVSPSTVCHLSLPGAQLASAAMRTIH